MNILNLFKVSLKAVANNKMRSFLSMLGIIIGVAAVIIMMSIGQGSKESIRKELSTMGTNLLTIRSKSTSGRTPCNSSNNFSILLFFIIV